jgi:hypothetical protein
MALHRWVELGVPQPELMGRPPKLELNQPVLIKSKIRTPFVCRIDSCADARGGDLIKPPESGHSAAASEGVRLDVMLYPVRRYVGPDEHPKTLNEAVISSSAANGR